MLPAISQGLVLAFVALGVFLTYRILNVPDLTVDGSFTTGAAVAATLIAQQNVNPYVATLLGAVAGGAAGLVTGLLHTALKIDALLASILTMIALYSVNLRIMGGPNTPLLRGPDGGSANTVFKPLKDAGLLLGWQTLVILACLALAFKLLVDWFLATDFGLAVQATGDNPGMASAMGISVNYTKIVALVASNALVGLGGALYAQFQGSADAQMGVGMILVGLASVIVGNAILGTRYMFLASLGVVLGSVLYRLVIYWALLMPFLGTQDMKLISAVLVVIALVFSQNEMLRRYLAKLSPWRSKPDAPAPLLTLDPPPAPHPAPASAKPGKENTGA